jgi:hypothetical protein
VRRELLLLAAAGTALPLAAQGPPAPARPRPYPLFESRPFSRAVEQETRTRTGRPGPKYWQQFADYKLQATLDPATKKLSGQATVTYHNRSPDTLRVVVFHLYQDLFAPNGIRNEAVPITGGMQLTRVVAQGRALAEATDDTSAAYQRFATVMYIRLAEPLLPGASAPFEFAWSFTVTPDGAPRGGTDGEVFFLSYWYPQVAVYDDVNRWQDDPYKGTAEFYMGYANYDVALTVPEGWLIGATGALQNADQVLSPATRERLARATQTRETVHIVADAERGAGKATARGSGGQLTWRYRAENVRDFAFGVSDQYLWDATTATVGDLDSDTKPDRTLIHTFYRPSRRQWAWDQSARYAQHSIEFLSSYLWPYPYPHATAVDGVTSCAGMEYPMITCIGGQRDTLTLYSVIVHELGHMWFPMQVGSDEKRFAWQDEGLTRFNQSQGMQQFFKGLDREGQARDNYQRLARAGGEVELMRHGDLYPYDSPAYSIASYDKMATNMVALRGLVGDRRFREAYREYGKRWLNKHPTPWDFWNTFNEVLGQNLNWFWRTWWFETWTLDHAVGEVKIAGDSTSITIDDLGLAPMPARIAVRRADGSTQRMEIPVTTWLFGEKRWTFKLRSQPAITSIEIDPEKLFPDMNRENNVWRNVPK